MRQERLAWMRDQLRPDLSDRLGTFDIWSNLNNLLARCEGFAVQSPSVC